MATDVVDVVEWWNWFPELDDLGSTVGTVADRWRGEQ
jgi:hypothetical protein